MNYDTGIKREWLVANGLGGYASSTVIASNARKYHGLLVAALNPPVRRTVLFSSIDETLCIDNEVFELSVHKYPETVHPEGFKHLKFFEMDMFPCFVYEAGGITIKKTVFMEHEKNAVFVEYDILNPEKICGEIMLRPLITHRDFHSTMRRQQVSFDCDFINDVCSVTDDGERILSLAGDTTRFVKSENWYYNMEYDCERFRGLDYQEDVYSPGYFIDCFKENKSLCIAAACQSHGYNETALYDVVLNWKHVKDTELDRRQKLVERAGYTNSFVKTLVIAADSFIVSRDRYKSIIAGYHWFSDWGRDAMISLPGLTLATHRFDDAQNILLLFETYTRDGLIPNNFTEMGKSKYNSADAPLWFIHACYKYLECTADAVFVKKHLWHTIQSIISYYRSGTDHIHADTDGLIVSGAQMTWMDAKFGDWIATPRAGKACEINALWYNALKIAEHMADLFDCDHTVYRELSLLVKKSYEKFWNQSLQCLFDVLADRVDDSIRPNQIFAVALPFRVVSKKHAEKIIETVERLLLTPFGLRSLSSNNPCYKKNYCGDARSRDASYHQGTVWPWLLGAFITAYLNIHGQNEQSLKYVRKLLLPLTQHLSTAGLGSISEVFDADQPHTPGGCVSQAWNVAEMLRLVNEYRGVFDQDSL